MHTIVAGPNDVAASIQNKITQFYDKMSTNWKNQKIDGQPMTEQDFLKLATFAVEHPEEFKKIVPWRISLDPNVDIKTYSVHNKIESQLSAQMNQGGVWANLASVTNRIPGNDKGCKANPFSFSSLSWSRKRWNIVWRTRGGTNSSQYSQ